MTGTQDARTRLAFRLASRALRRRCPNCGGRRIWKSWLRMEPTCPDCGLHLERGEHGYVVGSYMFNIVASELLFAAVFVSVMLATWPDPPWPLLQWGGAALMILAPILFYPFSKTLFLAFDLLFRPQGFDAGDARTDPGNRR